IRDFHVTGVQTCALPISSDAGGQMLTGYKLCMFICVCLIFLAACQPDTGPSPAARDLLLPIEALPEHWELAVTPRPMGPNIGFRSEERRVGKGGGHDGHG